jgi:dTDP-4-amino-4,6-dideoxygalactose transaminase
VVDLDHDSGSSSAKAIQPAITRKAKAIIVVHIVGWACDMDAFLGLASEQGLKVIEECAQAHGATYKSRQVGLIGYVAFSFCSKTKS